MKQQQQQQQRVGLASTLRARTAAEMAAFEAETDAFLANVPPLPGLAAPTAAAAVVVRPALQPHSAHGANSSGNSELSARSLSDTATPPLEVSGSADPVDAQAVVVDDDDDELYMPLSVVAAVNEFEEDETPLTMAVNLGGVDSPRATSASTPSRAQAIAKKALPMATIVDILVVLFLLLYTLKFLKINVHCLL